MGQVQKQVMVEKSVDDVMMALIKAVADVKVAVKSGGSVAVEGAAIATSLISDLFPVMGEIGQLQADIVADKIGSERAVAANVPDLIIAILG